MVGGTRGTEGFGEVRPAARYAAESAAEGEFRCASCGYGVSVWTVLPSCPMCAGTAWERVRGRALTAPVSGGTRPVGPLF